MSKRFIHRLLQYFGLEIRRHDGALEKYAGLYKRYDQLTMIPEHSFILNLELCDAFRHVNGDYVECGVWRGGMSAAIAEVLGPGRQIHLFDSFEGLPPARDIDGREALVWQHDTTSAGYHDNIMICLDHLFPKVAEGGIVLLDDYYTWDGCAKAVHDYLSKTKSPSRLHQWNNHVPFIIKKN